MPSTTPTRERILDEAMRLFSEHGYAATSIAKIEAAAGLTPGAGGLYHHFASKEAVLAAGDVLGIPEPVDDVALVDTWVSMMATALAAPA